MAKHKPSGSAIFMYCVIALAVAVSIVSFVLYYGGFCSNGAVLWTGVTAFTVMYHFWGRIIMGNVTKLFKIDYRHWWFNERNFEKELYKVLKVKKWKDKALTYRPELFSLKDYSLEEIANTMSKAETDHWVNEVISLTTLLFALLWGEFWIFAISAFVAMLFDGQFIVIQRYNRPRVVKAIEREKRKKAKLLA